ncbi:MAG: nucleotidyltransferase domain-containing protein [Nanoarchaeota archaeon]|nr:nucleotidyltransferase domain-containing protein [Nanoarchaeota archaeon]
MKKIIQKLCKQLEKEQKIKILFAIENGSRAWRMSSNDSDYDVRFIYTRPVKDYLQINHLADVIERKYDAKGKIVHDHAIIDMSGFDVLKFAKMLSSSNPTVIEWLTTDIIYYGKQNSIFKHHAEKNYSKQALYHHYKSMCRNNYLKYLKSGSDITYKRYLYCFRGLINAKWVAHKKGLPPIQFTTTLQEAQDIIPKNIIQRLQEIIKLKIARKEKDIINKIPVMDTYIEDFLKNDDEAPQERSHATLNDLNKELQQIILRK